MSVKCNKLYLRNDLPSNQDDLDSREGNGAYQSISEDGDSPRPPSPPFRNWPVYNANEIGDTQRNQEHYNNQYSDGSTHSSPLIRPLAAVAAILKPGGVSFITNSTIFSGIAYARRRVRDAMHSKYDEPVNRYQTWRLVNRTLHYANISLQSMLSIHCVGSKQGLLLIVKNTCTL